MLTKLTIHNYALIDEIEMDFSKGLHILTGETGAGKSIILGALGLIMGKRADSKALYDPSKNCMVEAHIEIKNYSLEKLLIRNDIDPDTELIVRRVINSSGKSRAFINDIPVSLKSLQEIVSQLIQIHNQFDNLDLSQPAYQLKMLDALAKNKNLLETYYTIYKNWKSEQKTLDELREQLSAFQKERNFIEFQFEELKQADLEIALEDDLEAQLEVMTNAESIEQVLRLAFHKVSEDDNSVVSQLKSLIRELQNTGGTTKLIEGIIEQLDQEAEQLEALSNEIFEQADKIEYDPERIEDMQNRLDLINKLQNKHNLQNISELISLRDEFESQLLQTMEIGDRIITLERNISRLETELIKLAEKLTEKRKKASNKFISRVVDQLQQLAMPHVSMKGLFNQTAFPEANGMDEFELLFSANKGSEPEKIRNVASGGELSRLSLSIKSILAGTMSLPTLIFDEIEAGISGEVAMKMGKILKELSVDHQIINITHSAQIASRGDIHYMVYKSHDTQRTVTRIRCLDKEDRIAEIAKMLSGDPPTQTAIKNAEELIHLN